MIFRSFLSISFSFSLFVLLVDSRLARLSEKNKEDPVPKSETTELSLNAQQYRAVTQLVIYAYTMFCHVIVKSGPLCIVYTEAVWRVSLRDMHFQIRRQL